AAAIAAAHSGGVALIDIPAEAELTQPVRITLSGDHAQVVHGHLLVRAGHHSKAIVVIDHQGSTSYSEVLTIVAGDASELTVVSLQEWSDDSLHLGQHDVVVGRDAAVRHIAVSL